MAFAPLGGTYKAFVKSLKMLKKIALATLLCGAAVGLWKVANLPPKPLVLTFEDRVEPPKPMRYDEGERYRFCMRTLMNSHMSMGFPLETADHLARPRCDGLPPMPSGATFTPPPPEVLRGRSYASLSDAEVIRHRACLREVGEGLERERGAGGNWLGGPALEVCNKRFGIAR